MANEHIIQYRLARYDSAKVRQHTPNAHVMNFHFNQWRLRRSARFIGL